MSAFGEFHEPGETFGSVATETVSRDIQFFHTLYIEDGVDVRFARDTSKDRTELRCSTAGLDLLERLLRQARAEEAKRLRALDGEPAFTERDLLLRG